MVEVRWTGAGGLELTHGGRTILVDPYLSRPGKLEIFFGRPTPRVGAVEKYLQELHGELSAIIVGHTHIDHALDIPEFAKRFDGPVIGSASLRTLLAKYGMADRVTVCRGGERIPLPGEARVTMIPSRHGLVALGRVPYPGEIEPSAALPMKGSQYRHGTVFNPKLEIGGLVLLHVGSANFVESELTGERCDALFMCVPGWKKVPGYADRLPGMLAPKTIVPFHFDDFSVPLPANRVARNLPLQDLPGFIRCLSESAPHAAVRVPRTFEKFTLGGRGA